MADFPLLLIYSTLNLNLLYLTELIENRDRVEWSIWNNVFSILLWKKKDLKKHFIL